MSSHDTISESLGIALEPIKQIEEDNIDLPVITAESIPSVITTSKDAEEDYQFVREKLKNLVNTGLDNLVSAIETANDLQTPRAWEVTSIMMKNISEVTEKLTTLHVKTAELKKLLDFNKINNNSDGVNVNIEIGVFVSGSADMLRLIKDAKDSLKEFNVTNTNSKENPTT